MHLLSYSSRKSGVWSPLIWVFCLGSENTTVKASALLCPHQMFGEGDVTRFPWVVGRIHFLVAVRLRAAFFFKVIRRMESESAQRLVSKLQGNYRRDISASLPYSVG